MKQYKVLLVDTFEEMRKGNYEKLETVMNDMSKDGWELVCYSPQPGSNHTHLLVTFCKDI
ncbi:MAG: DUF4177 domain-containing protein [Ruminiclostridium sp.]|nr:DUF4177 domain-containing protein [Ruminiclostridium sp.]